MNVVVKAWNNKEALAIVDGTRVRVRRLMARPDPREPAEFVAVRWTCQEHGPFINDPGGCPHIAAFAATTPPAQAETKKEKN